MKHIIKAIGVTMAFGLSFSAGPVLADPFRIIVTETETPLVPNSLLYLAKEEGYFDRAGVDVKLVPTAQTPMAVAALRSGQGEMANISVDALISLHREGVNDVVAIHSSGKTIPYVIAGRKDLTLETMAGSSFGIGRIRSLDHELSSRVLEGHRVNIDTLQLVPLGEPKVRAQALATGRIDATTISIGSFLAMPERDRFKILVDVTDFFETVPLVTKVDVVRRSTLETRADEVDKVLEALTLAARDYAQSPEKWVKAMERARPDVKLATLSELAKIYQGSWTVNGGLQFGELIYTAKNTQSGVVLKVDGEDTPFRIEVENWANFHPMDRVLTKIGTSDLGDPLDRE
jgi:NitT/TauT family transport system substrate-binding protein